MILGVPSSARSDADFEATVAIGLLLGRQSSVGGPLLLGAVLPLLLDKKCTFGWARSPGGYKCLLCIVHGGGGKTDISCSNIEKNGSDQWVSHASTWHSALLPKTVERVERSAAASPPLAQGQSVLALFARGGTPPSASAGGAAAGAGSVEAAAAAATAAAAAGSSRADTGRSMKCYNSVMKRRRARGRRAAGGAQLHGFCC
jgi:hypothetical protein